MSLLKLIMATPTRVRVPSAPVMNTRRPGWRCEGWSGGFSDKFGEVGRVDNPNSLQNICINLIADRLDEMCQRLENSNVSCHDPDGDREHVARDSDMLRY